MAALGAWLCFEDEAGFSMTPPTARTWVRRGHTPVIRVRGCSQRRFSIAALACYKLGERSRLIYRPKQHVDHKRGGRRSFTWSEYRDLLIAAHQQLGAPIVLVWDNLNVHRDRRLREFIDTHDWITCCFLPAYAPDLNPVEGIWSLLRRSSQAKHHRLHRPRPPGACPSAWPPRNPVPQRPHRRMPGRDRPHHDDITPAKSFSRFLGPAAGRRTWISVPSMIPICPLALRWA